MPRIMSVRVVRYPVVHIVFDDGLEGEIDHSHHIANGEIFQPLRDPELFNHVSVCDYGHCYGWNLDKPYDEIDFGADATHTRIEIQIVEAMAERYRQRCVAAE